MENTFAWQDAAMTRPHVVILAAGEGSRMNSGKPKVLQHLAGRPMLAHLLDSVAGLDPATTTVVVGVGQDQVRAAFADHPHHLAWAVQTRQNGTGDAVRAATPVLPEEGTVLILPGDTPLISTETLEQLDTSGRGHLSLLSMRLDDPAGYGRIIRNDAGDVTAIVEERDADEAQRQISEVNSGIMQVEAGRLKDWLSRLDNDNAQGEYYLTDIVGLAVADGVRVTAVVADHPGELRGANTRAQLAGLERSIQQRIVAHLQDQGVTVMDPARIDVRGTVECGRDVVLDVNVVLTGRNVLGDGVEIGPGCVISDSELAPGTRVLAHSVLEGVVTEGSCSIGPFARCRPGTVLAQGVKIGNFVETKKARLGQGSKASHLSYLGDSEIGAGVNIGAGVITCNYDGANKHTTTIGDDVFVGSDVQLVAPVNIQNNATIGAGTTVTRDVGPGKLAISRSKQRNIEGWKRPKKESEKQEGK